jgi:hypothetical protein
LGITLTTAVAARSSADISPISGNLPSRCFAALDGGGSFNTSAVAAMDSPLILLQSAQSRSIVSETFLHFLMFLAFGHRDRRRNAT